MSAALQIISRRQKRELQPWQRMYRWKRVAIVSLLANGVWLVLEIARWARG